MASSTIAGICDSYLDAFAIVLRASLPQMGMLSAPPQLTGSVLQLLSVWLCPLFRRRHAIVTGVALQAFAVLDMALLREDIAAWFIPRLVELRVRRGPEILQVVPSLRS